MLYVGMDGWMAWDGMVIIGKVMGIPREPWVLIRVKQWNGILQIIVFTYSTTFQSCQLSRPWETFLAECQPFACIFVTVYILYSVLWQILHSWYEIADLFCMTEFFLIIFTIEQLH